MDQFKDHPNWKRMRFKRNKVWVAVDENHQWIVEKKKVLIKYQLNQEHQYWVHPNNLRAIDDEADNKTTISKTKTNSKRKTKAGQRPTPATMDSNHWKNAIHIYTDGACSGNPGPAGIGVVMLFQSHRKEISRFIGNATNNIAELEAIKAGLHAVKNKDFPVMLYTDSTYAMGVLTKGWKAKQNVELVQQIKKLISGFKHLKFIKVKGHAGDPLNERADRLAVEAIQG